MWYVFLCKLGVSRFCVDDDEMVRLEEKIRILLYRPTTLEHLRVSKQLIEQYEKIMYVNHPLTNIDRYTSLVKLWQRKFKLWKRG
jgi:hypothetical protein